MTASQNKQRSAHRSAKAQSKRDFGPRAHGTIPDPPAFELHSGVIAGSAGSVMSKMTSCLARGAMISADASTCLCCGAGLDRALAR